VTKTVSPATGVDRTLDPDVDELWSDLRPIIAGERSAFAERCHHIGLSMLHLHLMTLLDTKGAMQMGRIAELMGVALPNATGLVSRMQERDLVERLRSETDRRVVLVRLTPAGRTILRKLELVRRRRLALALAQLTIPQRESLLQSIHALHAAFETVGARGVHPDDQ
jgi:DNA-binding MarR family transcriptional regulator